MEVEKLANTTVKKEKGDNWLKGIYAFLCLISIVETYSASSRDISDNVLTPLLKQLAIMGTGVAIVWGVQKINCAKLHLPSLVFSAVTLVLLVMLLFFGQSISDANRSLDLKVFTIQPIEMAKISVVFILSFIFASSMKQTRTKNLERTEPINQNGFIACIITIAVFAGLLFKQGMTSTILFMVISFILMILGGATGRQLLKMIAVYACIAGAVFAVSYINKASSMEESGVADSGFRDDTWKSRIKDFTDDWFGEPLWNKPETGKNSQKMHAYMAQAHGYIFGQGPGQSRETATLSLASSDYVFSIIIEEWGFLGGVVLIMLYFGILFRAGKIAKRCSRAYPAMLTMGMAVMIVLQAIFHIAINIGLFPVSGQTLPLISKGGTSIWVISIAFGVMLSVSRTGAEESKDVPDVMKAGNLLQEEEK